MPQAKLLFRQPAAAATGGGRDRERDQGSTTELEMGVIPKKARAKAAVLDLSDRGEGEPGVWCVVSVCP